VPLELRVEERRALSEAAQACRLGVDLLDHPRGDAMRVGAVHDRPVGQVRALGDQVARGVERGRAGEPTGAPRESARVAGGEQQRLLPAHAAAEDIDPLEVDVQPRQRCLDDLRHPRQVVDPARVAVREEARVVRRLVEGVAGLVVGAAEAVRADERERSLGRQLLPVVGCVPPAEVVPPVR
jgi:hypothetical protein